jgi:hypothetical protein
MLNLALFCFEKTSKMVVAISVLLALLAAVCYCCICLWIYSVQRLNNTEESLPPVFLSFIQRLLPPFVSTICYFNGNVSAKGRRENDQETLYASSWN